MDNSFGIQPPINWEFLYPDPQQRAAARARYETLQEEQQNLMASENEQLNRINMEMQQIINSQQNTQFLRTTMRPMSPAFFTPAAPMPPTQQPIPPAPANDDINMKLEEAKKKEQQLRISPTATAGELAAVQQEIKSLQDQLAKR
jgi:septal ring factor EnvC (AmiA/AmiB activator)